MSPGTNSFAIYVALSLAAAAAVITTPTQSGQSYDKLRWLLLMSARPDVVAALDAIGEDMEFPVAP